MLMVKSQPTKELFIVRHGATKMNNQTDMSEDRIRGWSDVPLSSEGIEEAHKSAADLLTFNIELVISSDLKRAQQTAEIIADACHCPMQITPLLRPWNLGKLQGQVTEKALPIIRKFVCDNPSISVPEGESFNSFASRAIRGLKHTALSAGDSNVCCVTHHRNERLYFAWRDAGFPADLSIKLSTFLQKGEPPGAVLQFDLPLTGIGAQQ